MKEDLRQIRKDIVDCTILIIFVNALLLFVSTMVLLLSLRGE